MMYQDWDTERAIQEYIDGSGRDAWVPAVGGTETPYLKDGRWWLYVWNSARAIHGFLDMSTDMVYRDPSGIAAVDHAGYHLHHGIEGCLFTEVGYDG